MTDDGHDDATAVELAETLVRTGPAACELAHPEGSALLGGRYQILSLVGHGGMGNVYRVHDTELDEVVALKTLHDELAQSEMAIARFRAEVKLARRVTHQNVARTYDIGTSGATTFLTMEFVDGQPLDEVLREQRWLAPSRVVDIAVEICSGLHAAHEAGVFHLDLKPANILIEDGGRIVISDFGIARARDAADSTVPKFQGTPAYMAPEQVRGVGPFDGRTDMYALGVMLFEMLTGELPFVGPTALATALARVIEPVPQLPSGVPPELAAIVTRCLASAAEARFSTVAEVGEALEHALHRLDTGPHVRPAELRAFAIEPGMILTVLPLAAPDDLAHVARGLAEAILDELSAARGLRAKPFPDHVPTDAEPVAAGRQLGAQVVVHGTVAGGEDGLEVRLKATSVAEGFQLWAQRFEGQTRDLFALATEAASAVAGSLRSDAPPERSTLTDPVTIDLYMRARTITRTHWHANTEAARPLWERLLERADHDPRVLAGAASYFSRLEHLRLLSAGFGHEVGDEEFATRAEDYANRAISAAPQWPEPYCARSVIRFNQFDFAGSLADALRALELAPGYPDAQTHAGRILLEVGPLEDAIDLLQQAHDIDPQQYNARWELVRGRALLREWDAVDGLLGLPVSEADQRFMRSILMARTDMWRPTPRYLDEPLIDSDRDTRLPFYVPTVRYVLEHDSLPVEVRRLIETVDEFADRYPRTAPTAYQHGTEVSSRAGLDHLARRYLRRGADSGLMDLVWLEHCPLLDRFHDSEEYREAHRVVSERASTVRDADKK